MKLKNIYFFRFLILFFFLLFAFVFANNFIFASCDGVCLDFDGDGYGDPASSLCKFTLLDCNDLDPGVTTGSPEDCSNLIDDDCDGLTDCNDEDCVGTAVCIVAGLCNNNLICDSGEDCKFCPSDCGVCPVTCPDGFCDLSCNECATCPADCMGEPACCGKGGCNVPIGECSSCVLDCNVMATNLCCGNGVCDALIGENALICPLDCNCVDSDGDGYDTCDPSNPGDTDGLVADCNDNPMSCASNCFPGHPEICDGYDNDCNGTKDDGVGMNEETCSFLCLSFYDYNPARIGNLRCCGDDPGEDDPYQKNETSCSDGHDNDCDGATDAADSDCSGICSTKNEREWPNILTPGDCNQCDDPAGEDNDNDQGADWPMADMCDVDCKLDGALVSITVPFSKYEVNEKSCTDSYDNDCDGLLNCADPDCSANPICLCSDGTPRNSCSVVTGAPWYCSALGTLIESCGGIGSCGCSGTWVCGPFDTFCCDNSCNGKCLPSGCSGAEDPDCWCMGGDGCCGIGCMGLDPDCTSCIDNDKDGYGVCPNCDVINGCSFNGNDCNDSDTSIHFGAVEICGNAIDEDCDGSDPICPATCVDTDKDGYGVCPNCGVSKGCAFDGDDCDDDEININPGETDICGNGIDENCDGSDVSCAGLCIDNDKDGYGKCPECGVANGCFLDGNDCNDSAPMVNPGATEICGNGTDENCDPTDDLCPCQDTDKDGYGVCPNCGVVNGCSNDGDDCDDSLAGINPGAAEICENAIDEDCDGSDLVCPCQDADKDGYGVCPKCGISQGCGFDGDDCNDISPTINPGATEVCGNGVDENCNPADDTCKCTFTITLPCVF